MVLLEERFRSMLDSLTVYPFLYQCQVKNLNLCIEILDRLTIYLQNNLQAHLSASPLAVISKGLSAPKPIASILLGIGGGGPRITESRRGEPRLPALVHKYSARRGDTRRAEGCISSSRAVFHLHIDDPPGDSEPLRSVFRPDTVSEEPSPGILYRRRKR